MSGKLMKMFGPKFLTNISSVVRLRFCTSIRVRVVRNVLFVGLSSAAFYCNSVDSSTAKQMHEIIVKDMLPFEGDTKVPVELTVGDCDGRIFNATIKSSYVPINYSGQAIILGQTDCKNAKWELAQFSPLYMENVLTMRDKGNLVPGWNLQTRNGAPVLSYCEPEPSSCRIFQFESSTGGALVGAKMFYSRTKDFLQSTDIGALISASNNYREHYLFGQPVDVANRKLFAAVGRVIVFNDGSCELLGSDKHDLEMDVLQSCKR
jgi:hypothetical protein